MADVYDVPVISRNMDTLVAGKIMENRSRKLHQEGKTVEM